MDLLLKKINNLAINQIILNNINYNVILFELFSLN